MAEDRVAVLRRRYLGLGLGELSAAAVCSWLGNSLTHTSMLESERVSVWAALTPLLVVLIQGGVYWLAARRWVLRRPMPRGVARLYRGFRVADVVLLAVSLGALVRWWPTRVDLAVGVVGTWLFAVAEYLNYFQVRLAYPWRRWLVDVGRWRTPRLILDLRAAR